MGDAGSRVKWVDYAKGICIILVVMFHTVNYVHGVFDARGWLQPVVDFARPFRIPDFFLISGLFLSRTINAPSAKYFDKKVVHFIYFYLLWLTIQSVILNFNALVDAPRWFAKQWLIHLIEPAGSLWFVHMLAIFYTVTRVFRKLPPPVLVLGALILQSAYQLGWFHTESGVIENFSERYVYFLIGFAFAPAIFAFADRASDRPGLIAGIVLAWGIGNWIAVQNDLHNHFPGAFIMGLLGATAVCCVSALLSRFNLLTIVRYCGQNSIVIYLTYAIPLTGSILVMKQFGLPLNDPGTASALALTASVGLPLVFHLLVKNTPARILYERPKWVSINPLPNFVNLKWGRSRA